MNKIASYICRGTKKQNSLEEMTGLYRERACVLCVKLEGEVMLCSRWNSK